MGGLVSAISAVLFIIRIYTDMSFEIAIAKNIFTLNEDNRPPENDNN